ncbi:MAG TPA: L-threonylcarbamoyladenylate synthase [Candidatus Binatia bacterium]|nr:L-threonylcarbamoyladenylate synthase [Candidatus Binatia bacterium]
MTDREAAIAAAVRALQRGELAVFPTETLYGIGCDALDGDALARLLAVKQRPQEKGIAVILADVAMLDAVAASVSEPARRLAERFWPGPLTLLFPARAGLPEPLVVAGKVAARVSSDPVARALARGLGRPIAAPSANPGGDPPARDVSQARAYFGDAVAAYVDAGDVVGPPSTLADPGPPLRILREGAIAGRAVAEALAAG